MQNKLFFGVAFVSILFNTGLAKAAIDSNPTVCYSSRQNAHCDFFSRHNAENDRVLFTWSGFNPYLGFTRMTIVARDHEIIDGVSTYRIRGYATENGIMFRARGTCTTESNTSVHCKFRNGHYFTYQGRFQ